MDIAFIGLGVMGYPMAAHLVRAGHRVTVFNRSGWKAEAWAKETGGRVAASPELAAEHADLVMTCVGNDDDVRAVTFGADGVLAGMKPEAVLVDHTTTSAELARELDAAARERGLAFLDAPVSGGQAGAEQGALTVMAGGDEAAFARAEPALKAYGKAVTRMGPAGSGQLTKMVNQIAIAGLLQGLSEALVFAQRAGLDGSRAVEVIGQGAAQSWQMDNRAATMLEGRFDFGFAVDWMRKDLGFCLNEARRNGARLPVTALVDQLFAELQARGDGRLDTSSLIRLLREG